MRPYEKNTATFGERALEYLEPFHRIIETLQPLCEEVSAIQDLPRETMIVPETLRPRRRAAVNPPKIIARCGSRPARKHEEVRAYRIEQQPPSRSSDSQRQRCNELHQDAAAAFPLSAPQRNRGHHVPDSRAQRNIPVATVRS